MKKYLFAVVTALALACGATDETDELGSTEQPILVNETNQGGFRLPGDIEDGNLGASSAYIQCSTSVTPTVDCVVPATTKQMNIFLNGSATAWRTTVQSAVNAVNNDSNVPAFSGTPWTWTLMPDGASTVNINLNQQIYVSHDCSAGLSSLPTTDIRHFFTLVRGGTVTQLSEPVSINGDYFQTNNTTDIRVNDCAISTLVGGNTAQMNNVIAHAVGLGLHLKAGMGVAGCGSPNVVSCTTVNKTFPKLLAYVWQDCMAKTMNVTNSPGQIKITAAFQCPQPGPNE